MRVTNLSNGLALMRQGRLADNFWLRLRGLLGRQSLAADEGLILVGVKSVHSLFMRFPIDVVYVDKNYRVIHLDENLVPYRIGGYHRHAAYVIELPIGTITQTQTQIGDQLQFELDTHQPTDNSHAPSA